MRIKADFQKFLKIAIVTNISVKPLHRNRPRIDVLFNQSFGVIDEFLLGTVKHLKTVFSLMAYFNRYVPGMRIE